MWHFHVTKKELYINIIKMIYINKYSLVEIVIKKINKIGGFLYFVFAVMIQILLSFFFQKNTYLLKRLLKRNVKKKLKRNVLDLRGSYGAYGLH